jgi:hypothetical protein
VSRPDASTGKLGAAAREVALSLAGAVDELTERAAQRVRVAARRSEPDRGKLNVDPLDELDALEQRFRALEAAAAAAAHTPPASPVPADLEARFRELEERFAKEARELREPGD